jgi:hypothetical protein
MHADRFDTVKKKLAKTLLSSHEWVAWRVKCGLQPGEANT